MSYEGDLYRPPSEANSYILQATVGCSHNRCLYCSMYRDKKFRVKSLEESLKDLDEAARRWGRFIDKIFVADGDALVMETEHWLSLLNRAKERFPRLRRVSSYATAKNILEKSEEELIKLRENGLTLLYIGPESGDDATLKRLVKGATAEEHLEAAQKAHRAGMELSVIFLLGAGGIERTMEHREASTQLLSGMDPRYASALTLTVIPETPLATLEERGKFTLPDKRTLLEELRHLIQYSSLTRTIFRTNHASNYLPLAGELSRDKEKMLALLDQAISGDLPLRPEWMRGL